MDKFFAELRRRNVIRVAGLYGVVGWLLAQAAGVLENALAMPSWFDTVVVSLLLIGLPIVLVFAWVFEMTPEGLKRTAAVAPGESIAPTTGRKIDIALIVAVIALIAVLVGGRFIGGEPATASAKGGAGDGSIAVLPFVDMSPAKDQEYFADGISEELLNVLAQVNGLQVAGRTSSFAFKNDNRDLREIGQLLDVSHILEGSVRKAGDRVRITAQLVKAEDGFHLWSATYDRQLTDIFAVQDEIAGSILDEMSPFLPAAQASVVPAQRADIGAYDKFLLAREKMTQVGSKEAYEEAARLLDEAIAEDGDYAPALAWRSYAASMLSEADGGVGTTPMEEALPVIKQYAERALAADPNSAEALFAMGSYFGQRAFDDPTYLPEAIAQLRKAVAARPNFPQAQNDLSFFLDWSGEEEEAFKLIEEVLKHDPGLRDANVIYVNKLLAYGRFDDAEAAIDRWNAIRPDNASAKGIRAVFEFRRGRLAEAWRITEALPDGDGVQTQRWQASIRAALHDGPWLAENAAERFKHWAALLNGDIDGAVRLVSDSDEARRNPTNGVLVYVPTMVAAGRYEDAVRYYDGVLKTPSKTLDVANGCGCRPSPIAFALKMSGHRDYEALMAEWKRRADEKRSLFGNGAQFISEEGDFLALRGDAAGAAQAYARAIDGGWRDSIFIHRELRPFLPDHPAIAAQQTRMRDLINADRVALGLSPIAAGAVAAAQ